MDTTRDSDAPANHLVKATAALYGYLAEHDKADGFAADQARMLARDVAFDGYSSADRRADVIVSRIDDTYATCQDYGFAQEEPFRTLWSDVVRAARAAGFPAFLVASCDYRT